MIERPRRDRRPAKFLQFPYTQQGPTTILPKKCAPKSKKTKSTSNIRPFNLEEKAVDGDAEDDDVTFVSCRYTGPVIVDNVDPDKVILKDVLHSLT